MKLVSRNLLLCSHKMTAVSKLTKRPRTLLFVRLDRTLTRQRIPSAFRLSPAKSPIRLSVSNNHLLENYLKLQRKIPQILPNTGNWLCYEEIQNVSNVMRDFPHNFKRDGNTGLLENYSGYKSKAPIFADNFSLFWSSKIKETYDRIKDFPVNMFWAPMQNSLALDVVGGARISEVGRDRSYRMLSSRGRQSGLERTRTPGGKIGRLNKTSTEYMALYNKLQKSRLEELKRKFKDMKLELERKDAAAAASMKNNEATNSRIEGAPVSPLMKNNEPLVSPTSEKMEVEMDQPSSSIVTTSMKQDALEGETPKELKK